MNASVTDSTALAEPMAEVARAGVATVYEAYGRRGHLAGPWHRITPGRSAAGPARIAVCAAGDNRAVHEVMAHLQPGEVLVLTMAEPEDVALIGGLLATQAVARGAVGVLVDAAVRDTKELAQFPLTILARWRSVRGATKRQRGEVNVSARIGQTTVSPGDIVVLDDDGATAVRVDDFDSTVLAVRGRLAKESELRRRWATGELSYDVYGMRAEDNEPAREAEA